MFETISKNKCLTKKSIKKNVQKKNLQNKLSQKKSPNNVQKNKKFPLPKIVLTSKRNDFFFKKNVPKKCQNMSDKRKIKFLMGTLLEK